MIVDVNGNPKCFNSKMQINYLLLERVGIPRHLPSEGNHFAELLRAFCMKFIGLEDLTLKKSV